ncbi:universal stress protein [Gordonia polyisoprenivorans]|uniref:universal stress protein n=1 Tax=Gordonia polyisoprenivorans TaxID=84595 RepID=UPI001EE66FFF|nr:universal stress protein [Gordonia polyisoprenivorans]UZF55781.1 universal stress protein [Gordonia polyisoprenivorans]
MTEVNYIVLVNDRPEGDAALTWALTTVNALGHTASATVHVVAAGGADAPGSPNYVAPQRTDDLAARLRASGVTHEIHSGIDDPASIIVRLAEHHNADMVVIGIRHRSAAMKMLLGSYTQRILLDTPCPVVAVKAPAN